MQVPQPPKKTLRLCLMGIKTDNTRLNQISQNEETRNTATIFKEIPSDFSGMYSDPREPDDASTRSWTYRSQESDGASGICFLPSDQ